MLGWLKEIPQIKNDVLIGNDNQLFLYQGGHCQFDYLTNIKEISKTSIQNFANNLRNRKTYCEAKNISYRHVVFPSKPLVQSTYLPLKYRNKVNSLLNQYYLNAIDNDSKKSLYYPLDLFRSLEKKHSMFKKLDTHMSDKQTFSLQKTY